MDKAHQYISEYKLRKNQSQISSKLRNLVFNLVTINYSASTLKDLTMESMHVPKAVMSLSISPAKAKTEKAFQDALQRFAKEDPSFRPGYNFLLNFSDKVRLCQIT